MIFTTVATALPYIQEGRVRALGVTIPKRTSMLPEVPTNAEAGLPGYEMSGWIGLLAQAQTPAAVIAKINSEVREFVGTSEAKQRMKTLDGDPVGSSPEEFAQVIAREFPKYGKIIRDAHMTPQ